MRFIDTEIEASPVNAFGRFSRTELKEEVLAFGEFGGGEFEQACSDFEILELSSCLGVLRSGGAHFQLSTIGFVIHRDHHDLLDRLSVRQSQIKDGRRVLDPGLGSRPNQIGDGLGLLQDLA